MIFSRGDRVRCAGSRYTGIVQRDDGPGFSMVSVLHEGATMAVNWYRHDLVITPRQITESDAHQVLGALREVGADDSLIAVVHEDYASRCIIEG